MKKNRKKLRPIFPPDEIFESSFLYFCNNHKELSKGLYEKVFPMKMHKEVSYRIINYWESIGLIDDKRENEGEWRMFSVCDFVWHHIILTLRNFGFSNEKIARVKDCLLISKVNYPKLAYHITRAGNNENITLIVFDDGTADIGNYYQVLMGEKRGYLNEHHLRISLNKILQKLSDWIDWDVTPERNSSIPINPEEIGIIEAVRDGNCESIKIKFSKGKAHLMEKTETIGVDKRMDALKKEHKFQSITQEQEDGKIVSIKRTSKEKL